VAWFAALEHLIRLRIQTKEETTPMEVLNDAVHALVLEVNKMEDQFSDQVAEWEKRQKDM
jgi:DNA-directed RNA polymerase subunit L